MKKIAIIPIHGGKPTLFNGCYFMLLLCRILLAAVLLTSLASTNTQAASPLYCFEDDTKELSVFYCRNDGDGTFAKFPVESLFSASFSEHLIHQGVDIVTAEEFMKRPNGNIWEVFAEDALAASEKMGVRRSKKSIERIFVTMSSMRFLITIR